MNALLVKLWNKGEGLRTKPYLDCCGMPWRLCTCSPKGKLTVGYGRNLDDVGITDEEAAILRDNDLAIATREAMDAFPAWFPQLGEARQAVIISMIGNLGLPRMRAFTKMIAALEAGNYSSAAEEMLDSNWARELGARATELAAIMKSGVDGSRQDAP